MEAALRMWWRWAAADPTFLLGFEPSERRASLRLLICSVGLRFEV